MEIGSVYYQLSLNLSTLGVVETAKSGGFVCASEIRPPEVSLVDTLLHSG